MMHMVLELLEKQVLELVVKLFEKFSGQLAIEGHTDDRPIHTSRFPSNWELSTARTTSVLRYLHTDQKLDLKRLHVAGYAHLRSLDSNDTEAGRNKNRRVEFVFEHDPKFATDPGAAFDLP